MAKRLQKSLFDDPFLAKVFSLLALPTRMLHNSFPLEKFLLASIIRPLLSNRLRPTLCKSIRVHFAENSFRMSLVLAAVFPLL
jgi:hypothetical protein